MARTYEVVGMAKISFADLSPDERQAFADFQLKERFRHESDIDRINQDLAWIADQFGIRPRAVFVGVWINCEK